MVAMPPHVSHSPASLVRLTSIVSRHGRGFAQSMPVDGLRWTLSTITDHRMAGTATTWMRWLTALRWSSE